MNSDDAVPSSEKSPVEKTLADLGAQVLAPVYNKRVLLLQGPNGPFFARLARHLRRAGSVVTKVNFNSGDDLYYRGPDVVQFTGRFDEWPDVLQGLLEQRQIDVVILFGDCRPLHRAAIQRAEALGTEVFVVEEGYLRPHFVTFERHGVNGYSRLPKDPAFYRKLELGELPSPRPVEGAFASGALHAAAYSLATSLLAGRYPHYRHHRDLQPLRQTRYWLKGAARRLVNTVRDRRIDRLLQAEGFPPFFFVPLQVHLDSQLSHSPYRDVQEFVEEVVESFARSAPRDTHLVVKHHPMDRAYRDYGPLLERLRRRHSLGPRLHYVDVINMPAALRAARGTVTINSTVGLSSIHHDTPVKCLGTAVYDMPGLAFAGTLDEFWTAPGEVDRELYRRYRYWLRTHVLLNGCVWTDVFVEPGHQPPLGVAEAESAPVVAPGPASVPLVQEE